MLVTTVNKIQEFLPTSVSISLERLLPFIDVAENKYLKEILGLSFLTELNNYANGSAEADAKMDVVLKYAQRAVTYLAFHEGFSVLNVSMKDTGFFRVEDGDNKSLFNYQEKDLREFFSKTGYNTLEDILEYMESNLTDFTTWAESDAYQEQRKHLINTAKDFTAIYRPLKNSRLVFLNMLSDLQAAEDFDIQPILGDSLFDMLKDLVLDKDIDKAEFIEYKKLLPKVQKPLAYFTIVRTVSNLGANFTDKGLFFATYENTDKNLKRETGDPDRTMALVNSAQADAERYAEKLSEYLTDNKDKLPEYAEFIGDDDTTYDPAFDQTDKKIIRM